MRLSIKAVWLVGSGLSVGLLAAGDLGAASEQDFRADTTGQLIGLCSTPQSDQLHTAAVNFCEGFLVGAYQYHTLAARAEDRTPLFCLPDPPPTRNESIARFIQWSQSNPAVLPKPPVEGMFEFLAQAYPCKS